MIGLSEYQIKETIFLSDIFNLTILKHFNFKKYTLYLSAMESLKWMKLYDCQ